MKQALLVVLACACLAVSACVAEPYGDRGYYHSNGDYGHHDHDDGYRGWRN